MADYTVMTPKTNVQVTYRAEIDAISGARCLSAYLGNLSIEIRKNGRPWANVHQSRVHGRVFVTYHDRRE